VICGAFVTFLNQISSLKFFGKIIPTSRSVAPGCGREFSLSTLFELPLNVSSGRTAVTLFFLSWAGDVFFDFEEKNFKKLGRVYWGDGINLNCQYTSKIREI
jgi:hypothetical protein